MTKELNESMVLACSIIALGEPETQGWSFDGDGESGPMGGADYGYRLGDDRVYVTTNGTVFLESASRSFPEEIRGEPYSGVRAMIRDHLRAVQRNAERNGLDFVKTGERPTDPDDWFHIDNILAREEKARQTA